MFLYQSLAHVSQSVHTVHMHAQGTQVPEWTIGDRMRKAREFAGMTQSEMAQLLQVGRRTVTRVETSASKPKRGVMMAWALATGVPVDWLETGRMAHDFPPKGPVTIGYPFVRAFDLVAAA